ncbi:MAG: HK97 gp10 family phage protein [Dehalogenimonas sp.]|nr:HK97 gp10 family phage protein [Dehalogenimonas sp.]
MEFRTETSIKIDNDKFPKAAVEPFKKLVVAVTNTAKLSTPVDSGRMRQSISRRFTGEFSAEVGTNVEYAPFVEFGTSRMEARHVTPGTDFRELGQGPLTYTLETTDFGVFTAELSQIIKG